MAIGTPVPFSATSGASTVTTIAFTLPAGIANGSIAVALIGANGIEPVVPSGWTALDAGGNITTFGNEYIKLIGRSVGSANSSTVHNVAQLTGSGRMVAGGFVIPGATLTGIQIAARYMGPSETAASVVAAAQTPAAADMLHGLLSMRRLAQGVTPLTTTQPASFTERIESVVTTNATGSVYGIWGATRQLAGQSGVSQGTKTITFDAASNGHGYEFLIPASAPTNPSASGTVKSTARIDATTSMNAAGGTTGLTFSIAQNTGTATTPILLSTGVWSVLRHATDTLTYTVTVTETASGLTDTAIFTVLPDSGASDAMEVLYFDGANLI